MFKCQLCKDSESTTSKLTLVKHVEMRHKMPFAMYEQKYMERSMISKEHHRYYLTLS